YLVGISLFLSLRPIPRKRALAALYAHCLSSPVLIPTCRESCASMASSVCSQHDLRTLLNRPGALAAENGWSIDCESASFPLVRDSPPAMSGNCCLGYPDQGLTRSHEAVTLARQSAHPF